LVRSSPWTVLRSTFQNMVQTIFAPVRSARARSLRRNIVALRVALRRMQSLKTALERFAAFRFVPVRSALTSSAIYMDGNPETFLFN